MALLDFLQQGAQGVQSALAPQSGFRDKLRDVSLGLAMGSNANDAISKAGLMLAQGNERRQGQQAKNRTIEWLQEQGVGEQEAKIIASDPKAFSAWYGEYRNAGKPDWKITEIYDEQGRPAKAMVDQSTGRFNIIGGSKSDTLSPEAEAQKVRIAGAGAPNITTNVGEGDKFYNELDKNNAQMFAELQQGGVTAGQNLVRLDRLGDLLENVPTGAAAAFKQIAGNYGINTEGLDDIQAAQALINQMVPEQRPAGSGPMSDADLELFKQSVPRLINQPGGNRIILDTMKGIALYTQKQGEIANMVANREITPAEGRKMLSELENPLADFGGQGGGLPEGVTEEDLRYTMEKHGLSREEVLERLNAR